MTQLPVDNIRRIVRKVLARPAEGFFGLAIPRQRRQQPALQNERVGVVQVIAQHLSNREQSRSGPLIVFEPANAIPQTSQSVSHDLQRLRFSC
jgi:hypothetical protein